ncbi:hypothetical protein FHW37_1219 [Neorhizobium alkalisoli]|uniref:Uncharacterized protein n=1 Tax=Neorhizobium alkalisoli TaxID=528178 RepID=A0A561PZ28_9HYPH|nr:hypothetical protein FHW37_1219 [Neorhizobium alkalisoli]
MSFGELLFDEIDVLKDSNGRFVVFLPCRRDDERARTSCKQVRPQPRF